MTNVVKTGWIQRYSKSFMDGGWRRVWTVLHMDSSLTWYKKEGESEPKGNSFLKDVAKWFAVGQYTNGMPDRPELPEGSKLEHLLAIPVKASSKAKINWFLFSGDNELNEWMSAICRTLPPLPQPGGQPPTAPAPCTVVQGNPPLYSAPTAPGPIGFQAMPGAAAPHPPVPAASYPQQPRGYVYPQQAYPQQPYPQQPYPQQGYPQQHYAQAQAPYYPTQPGAYPAQPSYSYPVQQGGYPQQAHYTHPQQPSQVVYVKEKKGGGDGMLAAAAGLVGGAALGYGATQMIGGWGGGWGLGRWGSWSSLSSFGSSGSFGSFGSFD